MTCTVANSVHFYRHMCCKAVGLDNCIRDRVLHVCILRAMPTGQQVLPAVAMQICCYAKKRMTNAYKSG